MRGIYSTESTTEKRRKIAHVDRISNLPDPILILILSLLSTKESVQTSLLAKRFQNLWASVPVLGFDFDDFLPDDHSEYLDEDEENLFEYEENFTKFVDGIFEHREPSNLDSFKLKWKEDESDPTPATAWLETVAKLKPKFFFVHIFTENFNFEVPDSVFVCESLEELELELGFEAISPRSVNLPCLKKVTLDSIEIVDEVMQKLSGLPALEEMVLSYCQLNICDISSGTLKRLVLDGYHNDKTPPDISISTPSLLYLEVRSWTIGRIKFKKLESLVKACIQYHEFDDEDPLFLTGLSNVTYLELMLSEWGQLQMKDVLKEETTKFPTFNNLKTLKIGEWCMTDEFDVLACFLFHASNLEKLTLLHRQSPAGQYKMEISLGLGDNVDIMEINGKKNDKIVNELVKRVDTHLKTRPKTNIISSE
ncbi:F-box/LRR-repeat protein At4g14103-like isoform X1 [Carex rostrata]